jgi:hypothetical protein
MKHAAQPVINNAMPLAIKSESSISITVSYNSNRVDCCLNYDLYDFMITVKYIFVSNHINQNNHKNHSSDNCNNIILIQS